jgi:polysaccharide deacetylase 2 family uncharacterized protein YibQ
MAKKKLPAKGRSGGGSRYDRFVTIGIVVAVILIPLILWGPLRKYRFGQEKAPVTQTAQTEQQPRKQQVPEKAAKPEKKTKRAKPAAAETKTAAKPETTTPTKEAKHTQSAAAKPSGKSVLVAIVIDDLGQDLKPAQEILALPSRITFAVMPGLPQSKKVAELARQNGREVLLHLPMEYRSRNGKPAPGMLRSDMTPADFLSTLSADIESVPGAIGVNNHEGSALTENKEAMVFLMDGLRDRNLIFLDSLTSPRSVAYATARDFGLKAAKRDVFLDNDSTNPASVRKQLDELERIARERGRAIGIGHPHPVTISELKKLKQNTSGTEHRCLFTALVLTPLSDPAPVRIPDSAQPANMPAFLPQDIEDPRKRCLHFAARTFNRGFSCIPSE